MITNPRILQSLICLFFLITPAFTQDNDAAYYEVVEKPYNNGIKALNRGYVKLLQTELQAATTANNSKLIKAYKDEIMLISQGEDIPAGDPNSNVADKLDYLRNSYLTKKGNLEQAKLLRAKTLKTKSMAPAPLPPTPINKDPSKLVRNSLNMGLIKVAIDSENRDVFFAETETTVREFRQFVTATGHNAIGLKLPGKPFRTWKDPGFDSTDNHPVCCVNWADANAFCEWLTKKEQKEGRIGKDFSYRLPTDHEWSCAVGIGSQEDPRITPKFKHHRLQGYFPWGNDWPPQDVMGNYQGPECVNSQQAPFLDDGFKKPAPIKSFPISPGGFYDIGGNVWEWCQDSWDITMKKEKTIRGGGFNASGINQILSSGRRWIMADDRKDFIGFRYVLAK